MKAFNSDRIKTTKSSQTNRQTPTENIITQLEKACNQIRTHSGQVENSVDVLRQLCEDNTNNRTYASFI